ncbi:4Fe-4S binding protein, partial [bacterium]|nr:4Fe-4S binding protein [bacterium]
MEKTILTVSKKECTGCGACFNICPVKSISMIENEEGFLYPVIDETKCTNCGLCKKSCPLNDRKNNNTKTPECYAVMANDEIRSKSSSGGMFTLLANYVIEKGGYVCGAAFNQDWSVSHIIIDNKNDLDKLRGSKYLQSNTEKCFTEIKQLLKNNKLVLFTGTPCQVAGLYSYLGTNYDNLLSMEILCHGTPSYKILNKYLKENHKDKKLEVINFRDKSLNWGCANLTIYHDSNKISVFNAKDDAYEKGFHKSLFNRESCAPCKFAQLPRIADITAGDWWGIDKIKPELNDKKGTSLVLINNKKAKKIFLELKSQMEKVTQIPLEEAKKSVNVTIYRPLKPHPKREFFFKNLKNYSVNDSVTMAIENKFEVGILGLFAANNYGCVLTGYALYKIAQELGYTTAFIDRKYKNKTYNLETMSRKFLQKQNVVEIYDDETHKLNNNFKTFLCGSDQLWNYSLDLCKSKYFLLDFALSNKRKVAYATSFGEKWHTKGQINEHYICNFLFNRFNNISVRENYAIDILKNQFNIDSIQVLDPVFVCNPETYHNLAEKSELHLNEDYIFAYILDPTPEKNQILKYISEKLNKKLYVSTDADYNKIKRSKITEGHILDEISIEDWLNYYKHANYIITDSFHGTCFSIIFEKQFTSIGNRNRGIGRFNSLLETFNLKDHMCETLEDIKNNDMLNLIIDYNEVGKNIENKKLISRNWLKEALEKPINEEIKEYDLFYILN